MLRSIYLVLFIFVFIFSDVLCFHKKSSLEGRIVGGENADILKYPFVLSLRKNDQHICGASIIGPNTALTAAHCVYKVPVNEISFRSGSSKYNSGGAIHQANDLVIHEKFGSFMLDYDVAVVTVSSPFLIGQPGVNAVTLIDQEDEISSGSLCTVMGWGLTEPNGVSIPENLRKVEVPMVDTKICNEKYNNIYPDIITSRMICAGYDQGGKDACNLDSGGPLVFSGRQVGIVSWGKSCADPDYPGIYTKLAELRNWIRDNAGI